MILSLLFLTAFSMFLSRIQSLRTILTLFEVPWVISVITYYLLFIKSERLIRFFMPLTVLSSLNDLKMLNS